MKIHFLGTAASEGIPNPFCRCAHCQQARILKGKDLRTHSFIRHHRRSTANRYCTRIQPATAQGQLRRDTDTLPAFHSYPSRPLQCRRTL